MSEKMQNFNQSIKYAMPLIKNSVFKNNVYFLISRLMNDKAVRTTHCTKEGRKLYPSLTILRTYESCTKDYKNSTKGGNDFHLANLNKSAFIYTHRKLRAKEDNKEFEVWNGFSIFAPNKYVLKGFLKELKITKNDITYAGWLNSRKQYVVGIRFDRSLYKPQEKIFLDILVAVGNQLVKTRYKDVRVEKDEFHIPATIYDRWYDPFKQKVLWNPKEIALTFKNTLNVEKFLKTCYIKLDQYNILHTKSSSLINYFISNKDRISDDKKRENLYIVNHYINVENPYKRKNARKDWKFAAEEYLNEVLGKIKYKMCLYKRDLDNSEQEYDKPKLDDYLSLYFSKKEAELFIDSLKLKTKISAVKLRKIILDKLVEFGILDIVEEYKRKLVCRKFKVNKDRFIKFYKSVYNMIYSFLFYLIKYNYMLKNSLDSSWSKLMFANLVGRIDRRICAPPERIIYKIDPISLRLISPSGL